MGEKNIVVGIAEFKTARDPDLMVAYGLGSCVGVTLYDRLHKVGGMAHVMLPSSRLHSTVSIPGKYADTGIEALCSALIGEGSNSKFLEAKLVGGANMFVSIIQQAVPIGTRNLSAVREKLREKGIPIKGEDVGGIHGRTMFFNLSDGKVEIRKLNQPNNVI